MRTSLVIASASFVVASVGSATNAHSEGAKLDTRVEYRVGTTFIDPFELSGTQVTDSLGTEQRLRTDAVLTVPGAVQLHFQADVLDGVLFGDNGVFGGEPSANSGLAVAAKRPNATTWVIGLPDGADPLDPDSYVPVLRGQEPITVNHAYADVYLPVGLLRVGRQPLAYGASLAGHDGGRINRWGISRFSDSVDRLMFATKLDAVYARMVHGSGYQLDTSSDRGIILALFHDWLNQRSIASATDDARQIGVALQYRQPRLGGMRDVQLSVNLIRLLETGFDTSGWGIPMQAEAAYGPVHLALQLMTILGSTREISEGFAELAGAEAVTQEIHGVGAQAILDWHIGPAMLTMEVDYATGDSDPRPNADVTVFSFARDLNVGLLLFEHILAFESARSAAVGIENLASLGARSFPLTEVATDGRFTNAIALFPQVELRLVDRPDSLVRHRSGVLMAWPQAEAGAVDPVMSILRQDGERIADDLVNYHGGKPGSYYGTEIDQQLEWVYRDRFIWTLEAALLLPGSSLADEHGDAVPSFLAQTWLTFVY